MTGEKPLDEITLPRRGDSLRMFRARLAIALMNIASDPATPAPRVLAARLLLHDPALPEHAPYPDELQNIGNLPKDKVLDLAKSPEEEAALYFGLLVAAHPELGERLKPYYTPERVQAQKPAVQKFLLTPRQAPDAQQQSAIDELLKKVETALEHYARMVHSGNSLRAERMREPRGDGKRGR